MMKINCTAGGICKNIESTNWFFIAAVSFRLLLDVSYLHFINPVFKSAGFLLDIYTFKYIESWLLYIALVVAFPKRLKKVSDYLMVFLLFSFLSPLLSFYGMSNANREHLYIVLLGVALILIFKNGRPIKLPTIKGGRNIAKNISWASVLLVTVWMIQSGGLNYFNLDIARVYEFRSNVSDIINQGLMGYLNMWATKVFGPFLLAIALWRKKYFIAFVVFCLHILWFGISSHKSILFYPLVVTFVWVWFRSSKALVLIPIGMSIVVGISFIAYLAIDDIWLGSLFIRRVFFVPSFLTFTYYDFFSQNQFVYWSSSLTSSFIDYPYEFNPARLVGEYLGTDANANNSFLATGYMHAGIAGIIFYGILAGLLFRLIDSVSNKGIPPWLAVSTIIIPSQSLLTNADLLTSILTHGIGIAVIVLFLYRSPNRKRIHYEQPLQNRNANQNKLTTMDSSF